MLLSKKPFYNLFLAPIEPYTTNPVIRDLCSIFGARIVCRPKIQPLHLLKAKKWQRYQKIIKTPGKQSKNNRTKVYDGIQLLPRRDDPIRAVIKYISEHNKALGVDFIDLNFSCPGHKVIAQGRGGFFLKKPVQMGKIIDNVLKYSQLPVSIKIRSGFNVNNQKEQLRLIANEIKNYDIEWVTINRVPVKFDDSNPDALLRLQNFSIFSDFYNMIDGRIPIIANGGLENPKQIQELILNAKSSGFMIGRGAMGYPMVFSDILNFFFKTADKQQESNLGPEVRNINELDKKFFDLFFSVALKYKGTPGGRYITLGSMKNMLFYFIKQKFMKTQGNGFQLPPGYGFVSFTRKKTTLEEIGTKMSFTFPDLSREYWLNKFELLGLKQPKKELE